MTGIDRLSSAAPLSSLDATRGGDARSLAAGAIGELGHRALSWVNAVGGAPGGGGAAWADRTGGVSGFTPDPATLAQRGDVYGIADLARDIGGQVGASPMQEGELRRALEDFTRQAVVQLTALSGADGGRQVAGLAEALDAASAAPAGSGADGVIESLSAATGVLARANG